MSLPFRFAIPAHPLAPATIESFSSISFCPRVGASNGGKRFSYSGCPGPFMTMTGTIPTLSIAVCLGQTGSMTFLFIVQILSHSCKCKARSSHQCYPHVCCKKVHMWNLWTYKKTCGQLMANIGANISVITLTNSTCCAMNFFFIFFILFHCN